MTVVDAVAIVAASWFGYLADSRIQRMMRDPHDTRHSKWLVALYVCGLLMGMLATR